MPEKPGLIRKIFPIFGPPENEPKIQKLHF